MPAFEDCTQTPRRTAADCERSTAAVYGGEMNRLADATSPYLLQHADNPVDWWPWTDAAFDEARRRDVPILLSVGYAACHWCHEVELGAAIDEI